MALDEDFVFRDKDLREEEEVVFGDGDRDRESSAIAGDGAVGGDGAVVTGLKGKREEVAICVRVFAYRLWRAGWRSGGDIEGCGGVSDRWDGAGEGNGERVVHVVHADVGRGGGDDRGAVAGKGVAAD